MKKTTKLWLFTATLLIALGLVAFAAAMQMHQWNFADLSTVEYVTITHDISDPFDSLSVNTGSADVIFAPSADGSCKVVCYEEENLRHTVSVQDGTLSILMSVTGEWYDHISLFSFVSPKIKVYLPTDSFGQFRLEDIAVSTSTGDIFLGKISADSLDLSVSTGDIFVDSAACSGDITVNVSTGDVTLTDVSCINLSSKGSTGDIRLQNVIASETLSIKRSTGDIRFEKTDAAELFLNTSTGDVSGSLLSEKIFRAQSDTGSVRVPDTVTGGNCEINVNTGDINISIP